LTPSEKRKGYGKFQTYANFLKGEEKEQYTKYLENKRQKAMERQANFIANEAKASVPGL